jgi:hypothetical protein
MSTNCAGIILNGIEKNCDVFTQAVGADKDLILVNYDDFDLAGTKLVGNRESDDTDNNIEGLTAIKLKTGALQYVFEGTDYSVVPSIKAEVREDGDTWYTHSLAFKSYSKRAQDRKTLESLGGAKVIAITKDRSTGLYELFGMDQGLKVSAIERTYTGSVDSNFYTVTLMTPEIAVVKESTMGELAVSIVTAV